MIYFVQATDGGDIKIGTARDVRRRLSVLRSESTKPLRVLAVMPGDRTRERFLHSWFDRYRVCGEWFRPGRELLDFIAAHGEPWGEPDLPGRPVKVGPENVRCVGAAMGPTIQLNLLRLGFAEIVPRGGQLSALVREQAGKVLTRQRISAMMNAVRVEQETIETLAKAIGVKPAELTKPVR